MDFSFYRKDATLYATIDGEVDMSIADDWRLALEAELAKENVRNLVFDFSRVSFIDSSGLGVVLGRYRQMLERGGRVAIRGANPSVYKILELSGFCRIMRVEPADTCRKTGGIS